MRKQSCCIIIQQCSVCGAKFPVVYDYNGHKIEPFGKCCSHASAGMDFNPIDDGPTFSQWYHEQEMIRRNEMAEAH